MSPHRLSCRIQTQPPRAHPLSDLSYSHSLSSSRERAADVAFSDGETRGVTPLMAAAWAGRPAIVQYLLTQGAPWNAVDMDGCSAGDYAMGSGQDLRKFLELQDASVRERREGTVGGEKEKDEDEEIPERREEALGILINAGKPTKPCQAKPNQAKCV